MTLRTLNYGNYGIFLIMGNAGFCPSTVSYPASIGTHKLYKLWAGLQVWVGQFQVLGVPLKGSTGIL